MREYRYVSPVFEYAESREVARLLRAALTNNPNLYLTAISARSGKPGAETARPQRTEADAASLGDEEASMEQFLTQMRELFGLEAEATPEEIVAAAREMTAAGSVRARESDTSGAAITSAGIGAYHENADPARYVSVAHFQQTVSELNALRATRAREQAVHAVTAAMRAGKLVPAQRDWAIAYCQADVQGFENFVARQPAVALGELEFAGEPQHPMIHTDRDNASGVHAGASGRLTPTEFAVCSRLAIKPDDYLKRKAARGDYVELNRL
jgi:phage I-like protein